MAIKLVKSKTAEKEPKFDNLKEVQLVLTPVEDELLGLILSKVNGNGSKKFVGNWQEITQTLNAKKDMKFFLKLQKSLSGKVVSISNCSEKETTQVSTYPVFKSISLSDSTFEARLSDDIDLYVTGVENDTRQYGVAEVKKSRSNHSMKIVRMFSEMLKDRNEITVEITVRAFVEKLRLGKSYLRISELKRSILDRCCKEINAESELSISYESTSIGGHKKDLLVFKVKKN